MYDLHKVVRKHSGMFELLYAIRMSIFSGILYFVRESYCLIVYVIAARTYRKWLFVTRIERVILKASKNIFRDILFL